MKNLTIALLALFFVSCNSQSETPAMEEEIVIEETTDVVDMHTSENALDWAGLYTDTMPCADCPGILTNLTLTYEGAYSLEQVYLEKGGEPFSDEGIITWNDEGRIISLSGNDKMNFFVGENILFFLDENMEKITGSLADFYTLEKVMN